MAKSVGFPYSFVKRGRLQLNLLLSTGPDNCLFLVGLQLVRKKLTPFPKLASYLQYVTWIYVLSFSKT